MVRWHGPRGGRWVRPGEARAGRAKPKRRIQPRLVGLALVSLAALVGWGVLVWVAIHYGRSARAATPGKWVRWRPRRSAR
jgi:hypothetical protein